ncbi:inositol monophosphatase [Pycnococcus provasolii]
MANTASYFDRLASEAECIAIDAARDAGALIRQAWDKSKVLSTKSGPADLVTDTDKAAERLIFGRIKGYFPTHRFVGEEGTSEAGDLDNSALAGYRHPVVVPRTEPDKGTPTWYVDPVDGTTNFVHGYPMSCVSIGLVIDDSTPLMGVVYNPITDELFTATRGKGARLNGRPMYVAGTQVSHPDPPLPTGLEALKSALVGTEVGASRVPEVVQATNSRLAAIMPHVRGIRAVGSCALQMCYVAAGRLDAFFEIGFGGPWDCAAGWCIVTEAGGVTVDPSGAAFSIGGRRVLCAANTHIAEALAGVLSAVPCAPSEPGYTPPE